MNFRLGRRREEPEINLIPMIDVLLVILIFMMVTTSYAKFSELQINLPQAGGEASAAKANLINVAVDASEHYAINDQGLQYTGIDALAASLKAAAGTQTDPTIVIDADAKATHQSVINVMEAARRAGYGRITFTTQNKPE
ncbi:MAG: biopolymer transporter ExbD [Gallionella sp.]